MDTGDLLDLTAELVDAIAEATDHDICDDETCLLCGDVTGRDVFSLLRSLERALGSYMIAPDAHGSPAGEQVRALLQRFQTVPQLSIAPFFGRPGAIALPDFDGRSALRLFVYLKAVSMDLSHGSGWPRIET